MKREGITVIIFLMIFCSVSMSAFGATNSKIKAENEKSHNNIKDYRFACINDSWWDKYNDTILKDYIIQTITNNHDLKIASLRVKEFNANVRESFGKELPSLNINSNYMRMRISKNLFPGDVGNLHSISQNVFMMPLTANYELDFLRKNRDQTLAAKKLLDAIKYEEKATYISLSAVVATTYFNLLRIDKSIELQKEIIEFRKSILDITRDRNEAGLSPTSDVILAEKSFTEGENALKDFEKQQCILLNQLAVLTGQSLENAINLERKSIDDIKILTDLPQTVDPQQVVERPDVLRAEAILKKAKIDVSVARKEFFPTFSISGAFGFTSSKLKNFFNWDSYLASLTAGIAQSLFTGGQKKARLKAKKYKYEQMFETYQKTILVAFQEVNDSLVSIKIDNEKNNNNLNRLKLGNDYVEIIKMRYNEGDLSYFDTLQYQELLTWLKIDQINSKTDCLIDSLSLYKALGANIE